jgi:hypothetical protein
MALKNKLDFGPDEDAFEVLRERYARLQLENDALQKQVKALQEKQKPPKPTKPPTPPRQPKKSSIFLIIASLLVGARTVLFAVVEAWGQRSSELGVWLSGSFGVAVLFMILLWVIYDFMAEGWIVAGSLTFLIVATLSCCAVFDPVLLETGVAGPVQHPVIAATALITSFLFAASHAFRWIMSWLLLFVTDPRRALGL